MGFAHKQRSVSRWHTFFITRTCAISSGLSEKCVSYSIQFKPSWKSRFLKLRVTRCDQHSADLVRSGIVWCVPGLPVREGRGGQDEFDRHAKKSLFRQEVTRDVGLLDVVLFRKNCCVSILAPNIPEPLLCKLSRPHDVKGKVWNSETFLWCGDWLHRSGQELTFFGFFRGS